MSFPVPTPGEWRDAAERALKGRPLESLARLDADHLVVRPLHAAANAGEAIFAPRPSDADGRAWDLRSLVEGEDADAVNAAILSELEGGAASVIIGGQAAARMDWLVRALSGVGLEIAAIGLEAGLAGPEAADALASVAKGSPRARLRFHMDPITAWAQAGCASEPMETHLSLVAAAADRHATVYPEATPFLATGRAVHEAGGSIGQELGFAAACGVAYARAAVEASLGLEQALRGTVLGVSVDARYLDSLAKVRALRLIWSSVTRACGCDIPAAIEARSSRRMLAARDPWPNLLRLTAAAFAGAVGGADAVVIDGFTRAAGRPDAFARRQARNTQLVLMEEANLGRVDDPAAGSWFLDNRTRDLAEAGWAEFQRIEREGGIIASLRGGAIQQRVAQARASLQGAYVNGAVPIIGVTKFVDPDVRGVTVAPDPTTAPAGLADSCEPLSPMRFPAAFEGVAP